MGRRHAQRQRQAGPAAADDHADALASTAGGAAGSRLGWQWDGAIGLTPQVSGWRQCAADAVPPLNHSGCWVIVFAGRFVPIMNPGQSVNVKLRPMASWLLAGRQPSGCPRPYRRASRASPVRACSATRFRRRRSRHHDQPQLV
jgi:hypothetical protein